MAQVIFDMTRLAELIDSKYDNRKACAKAAGLEESTLSRCLSGDGNLKAHQIKALRTALGIKPKDMDSYFFTERVAQKQP